MNNNTIRIPVSKKIIFLDFDGVMDPICYDHTYELSNQSDKWGRVFEPECVENLRYVIEQTGADVVISSSWKEYMLYDDLLEMWKERNLPGRVVDKTPSVAFDHGMEIEAWLNANKHNCQYVILDDYEQFAYNVDQLSHLLCVDCIVGLTKKIAEMAVHILND